MKYELNNLLRACKKKEEKKIQHVNAYLKTEKKKRKEEDEIVTIFINVNAQDVNSYTH